MNKQLLFPATCILGRVITAKELITEVDVTLFRDYC